MRTAGAGNRPGRFASFLAAAAAVALGPAANAGLAGAGPQPSVQPNVPATPSDFVNLTVHNSPLLVTDPTDARFVVLANRLDGPDFGCALQLSGDAGRSWVSANPVPTLPEGAEKCYAPEAAFDKDGRLYYLYIGLQGGGNAPMGVFLTTSTDRGRSFSPPRMVLGPERYQARMALDPTFGNNGRIHLVWLEAGSDPPLGGLPASDNPLKAAHSDDGGRTFTEPVQVSDPGRPRAVAPAVSVGPDHRLHVVYYDLQDDARDYQGLEGPTWEGKWSLVSTRSTANGQGFETGVVVDDGVVPPERVMLIFTMPPPTLTTDPDGRLYAGWHDGRNGDWDVFVGRSTDGGATWEEAVRVNDDPLGSGSHQYMPRLSVAPGGRVDAVFYDRRGNVENRGNDVYFTYSLDQGKSFAPNLKLTTLDSDSRNGPRYDVPSAAGLNEFGSRMGIVSSATGVLAAWTDTRNTGRAFPAQEIFATSVSLGGEAGPPQPGATGTGTGAGPDWEPGLFAALAAVALIAVALLARRRRH